MDTPVLEGLKAHFSSFDARLAAGEARLGFKVAFNAPAIQAKLGLPFSLVAGLTRSTLQPRAPYSLAGSTKVALEAEVAATLCADVPLGASSEQAAAAVGTFAPAIEVVDFDRPLTELREAIREGVFHRSVALGDTFAPAAGAELRGVAAHVRYNGAATADVDAGEATGSVPALMQHLAKLLARFDQKLLAGDVVIMGAMVPPVMPEAGDRFSVQLDERPALSISFEP